MTCTLYRLLVLLILVSLSGCQGYSSGRLRDWMDFGTLTLDLGPGWGAHAQFTNLARLGYEDKTIWRFGSSGRMTGSWEENRHSWSLGIIGEQYLGIQEAYTVGVDHWDALTNQGNFPSTARAFTRQRYVDGGGGTGEWNQDRTPFTIGYSLHLGFLGISHDFRPLEFVDFLFGFFGVDFGDDDWPSPESDPYR